jgi:hypothetical protein
VRGIAIIDYDGDGKLDIFFTNGAKLPEFNRPDPSYYSGLLRGRGDGTFEEVTAKARIAGENLDYSFGVAAGDIDNDGDPDLLVSSAGPNALYRNSGDGTFEEESWAGGSPTTSRARSSRGWGPTPATSTTTAGPTSSTTTCSRRSGPSSRTCGAGTSANGCVDYVGFNSAHHDTMFHMHFGLGGEIRRELDRDPLAEREDADPEERGRRPRPRGGRAEVARPRA